MMFDMAVAALAQEKVWIDKPFYDQAECLYCERLAKERRESTCSNVPATGSLANEVAKARQHIKKGLQCMVISEPSVSSQDVVTRISNLEKENQDLRTIVNELTTQLAKLSMDVANLGTNSNVRSGSNQSETVDVCPAKSQVSQKPVKDEDDDVDLFGSDSEGEDAEAAKIREERLAAYAAKKSKKPALIAKSNIILDVKPWDDETDMEAMEVEVRKITCEGMIWGAAKLVPLAYGIRKLQISCVLEDEKVSVDWLTDQIEAIEDLVQSVDIAAFNKV